ncbi:MAG: DUF234 domain-containing protein [Bacteroidota bacterium]|nr:DUF234 domain-containing protein [Bacteroidota bacterium]
MGQWWEPKGDQNEVDLVAVTLNNKKAMVAEVKREPKTFRPQLLEGKIQVLKNIKSVSLSYKDTR